MRTGIFFCFSIAMCGSILAQKRDTVLQVVTIYGLPEEKFLSGSTLHTLDSSLKSNEASRHLGEVLQLQLPIYFRNYGSGMISGISMRGTAPQHTAVIWNGININSFSLGQVDFSILPSVAFDEVKVHTGGGSARYGSGAFGGTVVLNSSMQLPTSPALSATQEVASFNRYFTSLRGACVQGRWAFRTLAYNLSSQNNFLVLSTGLRQSHAAFRQTGILQDVEYKFSEAKTLQLYYWYHDSDREVQPTIGQLNAQDNQQDQNHRLSIRYLSNSRKGLLSITGGYINDVIVFNGSKGVVGRWLALARHEFLLARSIRTQLGTEWTYIIGDVPNYNNGSATEHRYDFLASFQKEFSNRLEVALNLRQPVVSGFEAPLLPFIGADYWLIKRNETRLKIKISVSKNYRIPTLNDRYWQNAGDLNLLPETSYALEGCWQWRRKNFELSNAWFAQQVNDWIQWVPSENGNFTPQNVRQVMAKGFEVKASNSFNIGVLKLIPMISYQLTSTVTTKAGDNEQYIINKQLIYTPTHTSAAYVQWSFKTFQGDVSVQYNSMRFTDFGNSEVYGLPAFALVNASVGKQWHFHNHQLDFRVTVRNLFNADYQLYSARAMPGRNFSFQFNYQLYH